MASRKLDTLCHECHSVVCPIVSGTSCIPTPVKRPTELELLLEALRADAGLPPELVERLGAVVEKVEPAKRAQAFEALFEELSE